MLPTVSTPFGCKIFLLWEPFKNVWIAVKKKSLISHISSSGDQVKRGRTWVSWAKRGDFLFFWVWQTLENFKPIPLERTKELLIMYVAPVALFLSPPLSSLIAYWHVCALAWNLLIGLLGSLETQFTHNPEWSGCIDPSIELENPS